MEGPKIHMQRTKEKGNQKMSISTSSCCSYGKKDLDSGTEGFKVTFSLFPELKMLKKEINSGTQG
jgi:hypothetical protein